MTDLLILAGYILGWLAFAVGLCRFAADSRALSGRCGDRRDAFTYRSLCVKYHGRNCWEAAGEVTPGILASVSVASLAWPLLWLPITAFYLATRKPTAVANQRRIDELERELKIGARR